MAEMEESFKSIRGSLSSAAVAGVALGLASLALAAPLLAASHPLAALAIRAFFSKLCHQGRARSFLIGASPVAVCVRCLGIYLGVAAGAVFGRWLNWQSSVALRCFFAASLLNGADVLAETVHLHGNLPLERFFVGALLGAVTGVLLTERLKRASGPSSRRVDAAESFSPTG
jgi:uncharacterized membrane protein